MRKNSQKADDEIGDAEKNLSSLVYMAIEQRRLFAAGLRLSVAPLGGGGLLALSVGHVLAGGADGTLR